MSCETQHASMPGGLVAHFCFQDALSEAFLNQAHVRLSHAKVVPFARLLTDINLVLGSVSPATSLVQSAGSCTWLRGEAGSAASHLSLDRSTYQSSSHATLPSLSKPWTSHEYSSCH